MDYHIFQLSQELSHGDEFGATYDEKMLFRAGSNKIFFAQKIGLLFCVQFCDGHKNGDFPIWFNKNEGSELACQLQNEACGLACQSKTFPNLLKSSELLIKSSRPKL